LIGSYILVVDDVRSAEAWQTIRQYLPDEEGSRVVVTTRFEAVAGECILDRQKDMLHHVDRLSDDDAKRLFQESVSESMTSSDKMLGQAHIDVSRKILDLCKGLPVAIVTIAGLVACKPQAYEKQCAEICVSLPPVSVDCHTPEGMTRILNYCYSSLPADLKTCSLYLSVFPKDSRISRKRLTRRWIAEGFISEEHGQSMKERAETNFNLLIRRNILKPVHHSSDGKVKTCQVHDMILEYIMSKSSEENFITVVGGHWLMRTPSNKVRRLSIHSSDVKHAKETMDRMNLSHVRSVTVFGSLNQLPFMSLKLGIVQVLDLEGCKGFKKQHVKDIFKMLLLKYLNLRGTDINSIPSKIGKLRYLETLDIRDTNVQKLPDAIVQLERLTSILGGNTMAQVTLKLPAEATKKPLRTLHILSGIEITGEPTSVNDFHGYTALRKLGIHKLQIQEGTPGFKALLSSIQYLGGSSLKNLLINDECSGFIDALDSLTSPPRYFHSLQLYGMFIKVPRWIAHLTELKNLTLSVTVLRTDTLELLQKLPRMFCLIFSSWTSSKDLDLVDILEKNKSDSEGQILVKHGGFDCLKLLRLDAPLLPLLVFSERAMGNLERLDMKFNTLEGVFGMDNLASLREVHMTTGEKAGEITKSIVRELEAEAGKYANTPRVVVYELAGRGSRSHTPNDPE
jgi:disease resistance protein RPM1